jgi:hypothetical protein
MSILLLLLIATKFVVSNHVTYPLMILECLRYWEANIGNRMEGAIV